MLPENTNNKNVCSIAQSNTGDDIWEFINIYK